MPFLVNNQLVSEEIIQEESGRLAGDPRLRGIPDELERARRLRQAAEESAIGRLLLQQAAAGDPRPIDPEAIDKEVRRLKVMGGCRSAFDEGFIRQHVELQLRVQRTATELTAGAPRPTESEIETFYCVQRENFRRPEMFHAAHIVRHVNESQTEEQARAGIEAALAELESGAGFSEAAERHSDCKGNGGDLGFFAAGVMVEEFEEALRALAPGQRSGIFTTPFGFHIAELRAREAGGPAGFEDVRGDIERVLTTMSEHRMLLGAVAALRSRATILRISEQEAENAAAGVEGAARAV